MLGVPASPPAPDALRFRDRDMSHCLASGSRPADTQDAVPTASDHSLLRRFRGGNQDAATQLYLRYAARLRALALAQCSPQLARRVDTEDIVQSVFCSFFDAAKRGAYDVPAGDEFWKILLVIALNKIRNQEAFHRAAKRNVRRT